jgi:diphthine synthase
MRRGLLKLVGLGLGSPDYFTKAALRELERSDVVYLDTYTGFLEERAISELRALLGERLVLAQRRDLEEGSRRLVELAGKEEVSVAVPGDPLIATTHSSLIVEAVKRGVKWRVVHGVSVLSAAISRSGLSAYRFGRTVTVPKKAGREEYEAIYNTIASNVELGLHTLVLLDTADGGLRAQEALRSLLDVESSKGSNLLETSPVLAMARIGLEDEAVFCGRAGDVLSSDLPPPPHVLIVPGKLHFAEREFLEGAIGCVPLAHREGLGPTAARAKSYVSKLREVLRRLEVTADGERARKVVELAESYVEDAEEFLRTGRAEDALVASSYAEGLLDGLRLIGVVRFEWPRGSRGSSSQQGPSR